MLGTFYGIGVGPGDPELLTMKAVKVLQRVDQVFAAASSKNDYSLALDIARVHVPATTPVSCLNFPMTFDAEHLEHAWQGNCETVRELLEAGKNIAFLTLGDPMTFSTFNYLLRKMRSRLPQARVEVIPGITAFQAAAACAGIPLAEGEETMTVISGARGGERLREVIDVSDNVVLMKAYKQFPQILNDIEALGLERNCCFVSRCGLQGEVVETDFHRMTHLNPHYLSLMIVKKRGLTA